MIINRNFSKFVVFSGDTLLNALNKINANEARMIFVVSETGYLEGVLSDGDLRRWLTTIEQIDLNVIVGSVMNKNFQWASVDEATDKIQSKLSEQILAVPLLDKSHRLVAVALPRRATLELDGHLISEDSPCFLIAEIGNNHQGNINHAYRLIDEAADAGANCAKFQMRDLKSLYRNAGDSNDAAVDLGAQYQLDLLSRFQLSDENMFRAFDHCRKRNIVPLCTPWDEKSLKKLQSYGLPGFKLSSADFTNIDLMEAIASTGRPMICSTGMSMEMEIRDGVRRLQAIGASYALLHCNSTYPAPFKDVNLEYLRHLKEISGAIVGYSGHERDIYVAIASVAMGGKIIEKHFTLNKSLEGNDHRVSLLPAEFRQMVEGVRQVEEALGSSQPRTLSQGELMNRETLAKSLVAAVDIAAGERVTERMIKVQSPGQGLQPNRKKDLIGSVLSTSKSAGDFFYPSDIGEGRVSGRKYQFPLKWGVPVRYHDIDTMRLQSNLDILEIHLSYKDMELDFTKFIPAPLDLGLVVHAPELFAGDHTLNLCSVDDAYLKRSIVELQRVIDLTRSLKPFFTHASRPCIVVNIGGFSTNGPVNQIEINDLVLRLEASLDKLDMEGVEVIPQTMPPFPWHFGGQQFHNLFVDAKFIVDFCKRHGMRVCLDVSHSKLACNHRKESFSTFLREVLPHTAHLHLADAKGVDGEGLQIGDGEIDWREFFELSISFKNSLSFIPEIWQGHKNGGEGAWIALNRLESISSSVIIETS